VDVLNGMYGKKMGFEERGKLNSPLGFGIRFAHMDQDQ